MTCTSQAKCHDHESTNCASNSSTPSDCCPVEVPICQSLGSGAGCYASTIQKSVASDTTGTVAMQSASGAAVASVGSDAGFVGVETPSVPTDLGLTPPKAAPSLPTDLGLTPPKAASSLPTDIGLIPPQADPSVPTELGLTPPKAHLPLMTATSTVIKTLSLVANSGYLTAVFPTTDSFTVSSPPMVNIDTIWEIVQETVSIHTTTPASTAWDANTRIVPLIDTPETALCYDSKLSTNLPCSTSTAWDANTKVVPLIDTPGSALCWNHQLQTNLPCSTSTTLTSDSPDATSSDSAGFDPPGVLMVGVGSTANRANNPIGNFFTSILPRREVPRMKQDLSVGNGAVGWVWTKVSKAMSIGGRRAA